MSLTGAVKSAPSAEGLLASYSAEEEESGEMSMIGDDGRLHLRCPVCNGERFEQQESREDSR